VYKDDVYNWDWFLRNMAVYANNNIESEKWKDIIPYIKNFDEIVGKIVCRKMSFFTDRPQDYVAAIISMNAFRIAIGGFYISSSGYPDVAPILNRVLWEISIRLHYICSNPVELSLAYMLNSKLDEIKAEESEVLYRKENNINYTIFKRAKSAQLEKLNQIRIHTQKLGYDPDIIQKNYMKTRLKTICVKLDDIYGVKCFEKAYNVNYKIDSGYSHGGEQASYSFLTPDLEKLEFNFGPLNSDEGLWAAIDIISSLATVASVASEIMNDSLLQDECHKLLDNLNNIRSIEDYPCSE
jgi:hypothetical protein